MVRAKPGLCHQQQSLIGFTGIAASTKLCSDMKQCLFALAAQRESGASEAAGLQSKLESPSFVILLHIMEKLLCIATTLPEQLQDSGIILLRALAASAADHPQNSEQEHY